MATRRSFFRSTANDAQNGLTWDHTFLKNRCNELGLDDMYYTYNHRLCVNQLIYYILIQLLLNSIITVILLISENRQLTLIDVILSVTSSILVWLVLTVHFNERLVIKYRWISYVTSYLVAFITVTTDIVPDLHDFYKRGIILGTFYDVFILYAVYVYLPIPHILPPLYLGICITFVYICFSAVVYYDKEDVYYRTIMHTEHLVGINILGVFYRLMRDIMLRSSFLDRHMCIEESILLRSAKSKERTLVHMILPPRMATRLQYDIRARIEYMRGIDMAKNKQRMRTVVFEPYSDVSILYADVVNYTFLTTTLEVEDLVSLLHDLFSRFDLISNQYNVQRIRFLGDCYYCVAGISEPNADHAKCCVDMGLAIILEIRKVRAKRNLDIDMRIGIHSGDIVAGVVGSAKFQYDIWSKDVDIANRLEATGVPGRVHISGQTLTLLDNDYTYEQGTQSALQDMKLRNWIISTYLIKELKEEFKETHYWLKNVPKDTAYERNWVEDSATSIHSELQDETKVHMKIEMDRMPIGKLALPKLFTRSGKSLVDNVNSQEFENQITQFWMFFRDSKLEYQYLIQPDGMFKYSMFVSWLLCVMLVSIQILSKPINSLFWLIDVVTLLPMTILLVMAWYKKLWIMYISRNEELKPKHSLSKFLYRYSDKLQNDLSLRISIYLFVLLCFCLVITTEMWTCNREMYEVMVIESKLFGYEFPKMCFLPWVFTSSAELILGSTFLFTAIPFVVKSLIALTLLILYVIVVMGEFDYVFETSNSTNMFLSSDYSHLLFICVTFIGFYLMERQYEYNKKISYSLKCELLRKQITAKMTDESINALLNNMLPSHVVNIYLTVRNRKELYYEEYEKVAIMFASIKNFDITKVGLRLLNEIICEFDDVLTYYNKKYKVEKIKVVNWTYIAASGLDVDSSIHNTLRQQNQMKQLTETNENASNTDNVSTTNKNDKQKKRDIMVVELTQFALDLMRTLHYFNTSNVKLGFPDPSEFGLMRVGIAYGKIMACVVGLAPPHYDIWGHPVNMASRMDSTGVNGHIQVTEEAARVLQYFNIHCIYRGLTFVKGCGEIPTYFVDIEEDNNFMPKIIRTNIENTE